MNKVFLLGRLTKDPEQKQTPSNVSVTTFTVAVNQQYDRTKTDFIDCVAWRNTAEFVGKYFAKGKPILVEGRLQVRCYEDKQGVKRRVYEVVCDNVSFVEGAAKSDGERAQPSAPSYQQPAGVAYSNGEDSEFQEVEDYSAYDDLPF